MGEETFKIAGHGSTYRGGLITLDVPPPPLYLNPLYYIFTIVTVTGIMNISTEGAQLTSWPYRYRIIE